jgi:hypothetical protein
MSVTREPPSHPTLSFVDRRCIKGEPTVDDITTQFDRFAGRAPHEGDCYAEEPSNVFDEQRGHLVSIRRCWRYQDGRWHEFTSIGRGATWAR